MPDLLQCDSCQYGAKGACKLWFLILHRCSVDYAKLPYQERLNAVALLKKLETLGKKAKSCPMYTRTWWKFWVKNVRIR